MDQNKSAILLLLDLSAAFDTVNHAILISRLSNRFGVKGTALAWFKSYLTSRQQFVNVEEGMSSRRPLLRGVPQGSLLGPLLYLVYTAPIADIIKKHALLYHLYADDTQLYISFNTDFFSFIICNFISVFLKLRFLTFVFCIMYIYFLSFVTNLSRYFIIFFSFQVLR